MCENKVKVNCPSVPYKASFLPFPTLHVKVEIFLLFTLCSVVICPVCCFPLYKSRPSPVPHSGLWIATSLYHNVCFPLLQYNQAPILSHFMPQKERVLPVGRWYHTKTQSLVNNNVNLHCCADKHTFSVIQIRVSLHVCMNIVNQKPGTGFSLRRI